MTDNPFVSDVNAVLSKLPEQSVSSFKSGLEVLNAHGVNSYDTLFSLMRDLDTDAETLLKAYDVMYQLGSKVDKRRAVFPLINALKSDDSRVRQQAAWVLGALRSKRAVPFLMDVVKNRNEEHTIRSFSIIALSDIQDNRPIPMLKHLMFDQDENLQVRCSAVEWLSYYRDASLIPDYITLLDDASADIRFWAAYGLQNMSWNADISPALAALDHIAAFDHNIPDYWGWHVDREALAALEVIYAHKEFNSPPTYLISPAPEFDTFVRQHRQWQEDELYETSPTSSPTLSVVPTWLVDKLRQQYPDVELNTRQPKPQTYLLDWKLTLDSDLLIGGLHRDGYGVVVTGKPDAVQRFAHWFRSIISPEHKLFLYEWAGEGVELVDTSHN